MKSLPTAFLPDIKYLAMIARGEVFSVELGERWQKQSFRNRAHLCTAQGSTIFSLPVRKVSHPYPPTAEVMLSEHGSWRHRLAQLLRSNYSSTPFWIHYEEKMMALIAEDSSELLCRYNHQWLHFLCRAWGLQTPPLMIGSQPFEGSSVDSSSSLPSSHVLLESEVGQLPPLDYSFAEISDSLTSVPRYWQVFEQEIGFTPHLSALDLLLNQGPEGLLYLRRLPH